MGSPKGGNFRRDGGVGVVMGGGGGGGRGGGGGGGGELRVRLVRF